MNNIIDRRKFTYTEGQKILQGKIVVFTGRGFTVRWELMQYAKNCGALVEGRVTKKTDVLIVGEKPGSKLRKAKQEGCTIISTDEFLSLLLGKNIIKEKLYDKDSLTEKELTLDELEIEELF